MITTLAINTVILKMFTLIGFCPLSLKYWLQILTLSNARPAVSAAYAASAVSAPTACATLRPRFTDLPRSDNSTAPFNQNPKCWHTICSLAYAMAPQNSGTKHNTNVIPIEKSN